ncbi:ABC transporter substrate-binding protein [Burkholderia aenigmatica]|uniref:Sugar ABC transporter substrate-binding protein n=1 Tax=Burkholderia aenigmatica TaxID=2015348 RepID=A0A228IN69_9BURK|nr:sugar ABC transporter substrate-binding protein [Burkholderia aenigmatica]OXI43827.1 sugar ABC transporter substrate-binding protein [Burkholderia aenigmatica]
MKRLVVAALGSACLFAGPAFAETLTIATVNNGDMIRMQKLTGDFEKQNPDIHLQWLTLEENDLRTRVTTDIATKAGQIDIVTIGTYEAPIWAKLGWLKPLDELGTDYDVNDILPAVRSALSYGGKLYAAPFYGESSLVYYRKDLFKKAGIQMPESPTWDFLASAARKINDKANGISGICLRGKAGWGENMAFINTLTHSMGGHYFAEDWTPQLNKPVWKQALTYYTGVMKDAGPQGAVANGFNENLSLFQQGKCGIWIDSSVAAAFVTDSKQSKVAQDVGFTLTPKGNDAGNRGNWLWAWALAVPQSSKKTVAAEKFISWATGKRYIDLVADKYGWANVPPGTRKSLYENKKYLAAAPFAKITLDAMNAVTYKYPHESALFPVIPEYQGIGTQLGQSFSAVLIGNDTVDSALAKAQAATTRSLMRAGYLN